MAKNEDAERQRGGPISRRDFLRFAWGSATAQAGEAVTRSMDEFQQLVPVARRRGFTGRVRVGSMAELEALPVGTVVERFAEAEGFYLIRAPEGWLALDARCTNLGRRVEWRARTESADSPEAGGFFLCSQEGCRYDLYGEVLKGPAPYPLSLLTLERRAPDLHVRTDALRPRVAVDREKDSTPLDAGGRPGGENKERR